MHEAAGHTAAAAIAADYLWLIPAFPALGVLFNLFLGRRAGKTAVSIVAPSVVVAAFGVALYAVLQLVAAPANTALIDQVYPWIHAGSLRADIVFRIDRLSAVMVLVVTGVGSLIHIYSVGYMHHDERFHRYFTYLNLFTFSMLLLVLADSLPLLFVGWEGVGVCSYLLIGFWFTEEANASAGKKAFVVNRVGDAGFLLATFLLFWHLPEGPKSLAWDEIARHIGTVDPSVITTIGLLLFVGATGKSAQLPLFVWLPDAMAGPTPVSALIHAATMVTAGVYMIARLNFLFTLTPTALNVVATVGGLTAIFAATIGLVQNDIKKVLAYSTVSQLGYMFLGVGSGAYAAGVFHLMTHAFFKGLLFLGSGSVIHAMSGEQDMRKMGGLREHLPITYKTFLIGTVAIAGIPGLAGFFSKDAVLAAVFGAGHPVLWVIGVVAAGMTSFYMFRLLFMTFFGECRADEHTKHHLHESPATMTIPLCVLAVLSVVGGWVGIPMHALWGDQFGHFLAPVVGEHALHLSVGTELALMACSVGSGLAGLALAYKFYIQSPELPARLSESMSGVYKTLSNKYYVDEIYEATFVQGTYALAHSLWRWLDVAVIDAIVNGSARVVAAAGGSLRRWQTGNVQHYAASLLAGAVIVLGYFVWR